MASSELHQVFVYGTLKTNQPSNHQLWDSSNGSARLLGNAHTKEKLPMVITTSLNCGFLLDKKGSGKYVLGELYEVDESMLRFLDEWESVPELYQRVQIQVVLDSVSEGSEQKRRLVPGDCVTCDSYIVPRGRFPQAWLNLPCQESYDSKLTPLPFKVLDLESIAEAKRKVLEEMKSD